MKPLLIHSSSEKSPQTNKVPIIVGSIMGGVMFMILIFFGIKYYHRRRIRLGKTRRFRKAADSGEFVRYSEVLNLTNMGWKFYPIVLNRSHIRPYDLKHEPVEVADGTNDQTSPNNRLPFNEKRREMINPSAVPTQDQDGREDLAPELISRPESPISVHTLRTSVHSAVTTSTMTARQVQLQEEANDLRDQVRRLQQTVDGSHDGVRGMQVAMERMMAHIQTLESQLNSDWARGLTNDPPPVYAEA